MIHNSTGVKHIMTTHGLRGTVKTLFVESGHSDSSIAMRAGHRGPRSLNTYQNIQSQVGENQQEAILCVVDKGLIRHGVEGTGGDGNKVGEDAVDGLGERCAKARKAAATNGQRAFKEKGIENDPRRWEASNGLACVGGNGEGEDRVNGSAGLLTGIKCISGGQFTINVTYHFRSGIKKEGLLLTLFAVHVL